MCGLGDVELLRADKELHLARKRDGRSIEMGMPTRGDGGWISWHAPNHVRKDWARWQRHDWQAWIRFA